MKNNADWTLIFCCTISRLHAVAAKSKEPSAAGSSQKKKGAVGFAAPEAGDTADHDTHKRVRRVSIFEGPPDELESHQHVEYDPDPQVIDESSPKHKVRAVVLTRPVGM